MCVIVVTVIFLVRWSLFFIAALCHHFLQYVFVQWIFFITHFFVCHRILNNISFSSHQSLIFIIYSFVWHHIFCNISFSSRGLLLFIIYSFTVVVFSAIFLFCHVDYFSLHFCPVHCWLYIFPPYDTYVQYNCEIIFVVSH